ncbi:E3 ubiquitin-protein ligase listerin isoform X2 [Arapaima gigas]
MGGKNKQRTKGNVRPSSSGRAAELLARDTGVLPGFVGFGSSTSHDLGYVPALHGSDDFDSLVDADFRLVLRKLSKRDTVTKLKAVQEFGAMCQEREAEVVKGVLPYWPRIYCRISVDHDRRVREAMQQAFEQLILKVKRNLAPYLKSIMGHWLIGQCDTYPPAASAASVAFQAAFPYNKQSEALGFCKDEVLNILQDNLLNETPETLSDPHVPEEERLAKYTRLVTSSLLALKKLLVTLSQQDVDVLAERLAHLTAQSKFWKYSKHKSSQIRGAFFGAVSALCEHTPKLVQEQASCACPAVLLSIDDTDPVVLPPLWEAVLHLLSSIPDCWAHVNAKKGVLPKLWLLLREGGKGLATILHPNLLPFVSKLPKDITEPQLDFYSIFFTSIIQGLSSERAASSPSESAAIVCATIECLRFSVLQNASEDEEHRQVQNMLLVGQLLPLVDRALGSVPLQHGPLFPQVADMLVSWEKRAGVGSGPLGEDDAVPEDSVFHRMLADFWESLGQLCVQHVDQENETEEVLLGIAALLRVMQSPEAGSARPNRRKKTAKICFSDPGGSEGRPEVEEVEKGPLPVDAHHGPLTLRCGHLEQLVCQLAELAMVHVTERDSERHLHFLSVLLTSFPSYQVYRVLLTPGTGEEAQDGENEIVAELERHGEKGAALARNPAVHFLLQKVVVWLRQDWREDTELLVDMVFSVLRCCSSQEEKTIILNHITEMELRWGVLLQIVQKACAEPRSLEASVGWLKGPVLGERLVGLAKELCAVGLRGPRGATSPHIHMHSWALISLVLSQQLRSEAVIGDTYVEKIIDQLHATLSEAKDLSDAGNVEPLVSFICDVASNFFSSMKGCLLLASAEELLLTLFQLCAQDQDATRLSDSLLQKLNNSCFTGIRSLVTHLEPEVKDGTFLHSAALWVRNQLLTTVLGVKSLQVLVAAVKSLVETLVGAGQRGSHLLLQFISYLTPSQEEWRRSREALPPQWVKSSLLSGRLRVTCSYPCMDVWKFRATTKLPAHLSASALLGCVLLTAVDSDGHQGADMKHTVSEVLLALQWCEEMERGPAVVSDYCAMLRDLNITWERLCKKVTNCDVLETLFERSLKEGALWALTLANYIQHAEVSSNNIQGLYGNLESFFVVVYGSNPAGGMANLAVLQHCFRTGTVADAEVLLAVTATLMEWRNGKEGLFLFNSDLKKVSAGLLSLNVEMMRFLCWVTNHSPAVLRDTQWDMLLCSMLAWLETATENTATFWNPWVQLFVCENCELIVALSKFFSSLPAGVADQLPSDLTSEWEEFFMDGIHTRLLPLLVKITEEFTDPDDPLFPLPVVRSVGEALCYIPVSLLTDNKLPARFVAAQRTNLPEQLQTLLNTLAPLLLFKARPVQLTVYHVLDKVMPQLPQFDNENDNAKSDEDDEEEPCLLPPAALMSILSDMEELLEGILGGVQVGEFAVVQPLSDEYCCILGYLLTWKLILTFFKASPSQLRVQYSMYLRKSRSLSKLLQHLFRIMPENPTLPGQVAEPGGKDARTFFTERLELSVHSSNWLEGEVPHLACLVYYSALKDLPAMVRMWWNGQEKRVSGVVEKFTSKYVSGMLSLQEIASVQASTQTFESMTVKARPTTREVIATYSVDDIFIELVIQLPQNYPLGSISVESGRRVGVAVQQWRNWMLQLSTYLTHQNGSIMEGLALWKNNVDKRFEGVEDCMICFSVIHGSNYSLPKKACRTCRKKFHSACLYKWFTSSNKSTCPLCRETFF